MRAINRELITDGEADEHFRQERTRRLRVEYAPIFADDDGNQWRVTVREGDDVRLVARAHASPPVDRFAWFRVDPAAPGRRARVGSGAGVIVSPMGAELRIESVEARQAGRYAVEASNAHGTTKRNLTLDVQCEWFPPRYQLFTFDNLFAQPLSTFSSQTRRRSSPCRATSPRSRAMTSPSRAARAPIPSAGSRSRGW